MKRCLSTTISPSEIPSAKRTSFGSQVSIAYPRSDQAGGLGFPLLQLSNLTATLFTAVYAQNTFEEQLAGLG